MKKVFSMIAVAALACSVSLPAAAATDHMSQGHMMKPAGRDGKIAVVSMKELIKNSPEIAADKQKLEAQFKPAIQKAQASAKALGDMQKQYKKNQATMRADQRKAMEKQMQQKEFALMQERAKLQQEINKAQQQDFEAIIHKVKSAVARVAERNHYAIVLPKNMVVYLDSNQMAPNQVVDITSQVSAEMVRSSGHSSNSMMGGNNNSHYNGAASNGSHNCNSHNHY